MESDSINIRTRAIFTQYLHTKKLRKTPERFAILDKVVHSVDHFSIDNFYEQLEQEGYHVSRATVYNTIELLIDAGLVRCHHFDNKAAAYEFIQGGVGNHHHLICTSCGKIKEVKDPDITKMLNSKRYSTFHASYFSLYVYGTCSRCARRGRKNSALAASNESSTTRKNKQKK